VLVLEDTGVAERFVRLAAIDAALAEPSLTDREASAGDR
jgi:hypothetical protein